jgi:alpha-N-arabinofuranosidase
VDVDFIQRRLQSFPMNPISQLWQWVSPVRFVTMQLMLRGPAASYGSPSYYAQKMFSNHHGDEILATASQNIPTREWQVPARRRNGVEQPRPAAQMIRIPFFDATRDSRSGTIIVKVVNSLDTPQPVRIEISGANNLAAEGAATVLKGKSLDDTNSLEDPTNIVPITKHVDGIGADFTRAFPPYSITVLELPVK